MSEAFDSKSYQEFLESKTRLIIPSGFDVAKKSINRNLKDFQNPVVRWQLRLGRSACFADCGLGKTIVQLEYCNHVIKKTQGHSLLLTPLAVGQQTIGEANKFKIKSKIVLCRSQDDVPVKPSICVTNYQKLHKFDLREFSNIALDEAGILKDSDGKTRNELIERCQIIPHRATYTATPAPNDVTEIGNQCEFLGIMKRTEMLAMFFTHNSGSTQEWTLKGHAVEPFWRWVASWAVFIRTPSDLGFSDEGYVLPELKIHEHVIESDEVPIEGLFNLPAVGLMGQRQARRESIGIRVKAVAELVNSTSGQWLIWCELNDESSSLVKAIPGSCEITGSNTDEQKVTKQLNFLNKKCRVLISKPSICGHGLNLQQCNQVAFVGVGHSFEQFYQAVRRCHRFGQDKSVHVHIFCSDREMLVLDILKRKQSNNDANLATVINITSRENIVAMGNKKLEKVIAKSTVDESCSECFRLLKGDSTQRIHEVQSDFIDYTIFSPPFAQLYAYTDLPEDMGNCRSLEEFSTHFNFLIPQLLRITKPGRLLSFHCMNFPTFKERDGYIGIRDFRGELIRMFLAHGWIYHSEVCIWKDPVTAMQRTKALGLLHKQLKKDSCMSRQGIPDYLVTMRKPGINPEPVTHYGTHKDLVESKIKLGTPMTEEDEMKVFPVEKWQNYASPVWMDIDQSDTLNFQAARAERDERHIAPLQLGVIERCVELWTNPGDLVFSPFAGIGSEGYQSILMKRNFLGIELKDSYFKVAVDNLQRAEKKSKEKNLFSEFDADDSQVKQSEVKEVEPSEFTGEDVCENDEDEREWEFDRFRDS